MPGRRARRVPCTPDTRCRRPRYRQRRPTRSRRASLAGRVLSRSFFRILVLLLVLGLVGVLVDLIFVVHVVVVIVIVIVVGREIQFEGGDSNDLERGAALGA